MISSLARGLDRLSSGLNALAVAGAILAVLVMVYAAGWQVIARYLLDQPPIWTEELARRAMVWAGMLGASASFKAMADPVLFPGSLAVRGKLGAVLALIRAAGVVLFVVPVLWFCLFGPNMNMARGFLGRSLSRTAEMMDVSMIWFTASIPIALSLILLHLLAQTAMQLTGQVSGQVPDQATGPMPAPERT